ncbi:MAG: hypothetical protein E5V96_13015 [Mesorhizobium sp.]|nr:MAG: hypothetical protein E5V96_13015 [Mesorhizobium sp.]
MMIFGRYFGFLCGRDWLRATGWLIGFYALRRQAQPGELRWRVCLKWNFVPYPFRVVSLHRFWPAWRDEPSALAEYERTMRGGK